MAHASRKLRQQRRLKRQVSTGIREVNAVRQFTQRVGEQLQATRNILLALLAQRGGEALITKGTFQQVVESKEPLNYTIEVVKDSPNDWLVKMVTGAMGSKTPEVVKEDDLSAAWREACTLTGLNQISAPVEGEVIAFRDTVEETVYPHDAQ